MAEFQISADRAEYLFYSNIKISEHWVKPPPASIPIVRTNTSKYVPIIFQSMFE